MRKHFYDICICAVVIFTAALLLVIPRVLENKEQDNLRVVVYVDGEIVEDHSIYENCILTLKNGVTVEICNGSAFISHSDCKDHICMINSKLDLPGEMSVCLPNRTVVKICGINTEEVDGVVG